MVVFLFFFAVNYSCQENPQNLFPPDLLFLTHIHQIICWLGHSPESLPGSPLDPRPQKERERKENRRGMGGKGKGRE